MHLHLLYPSRTHTDPLVCDDDDLPLAPPEFRDEPSHIHIPRPSHILRALPTPDSDGAVLDLIAS